MSRYFNSIILLVLCVASINCITIRVNDNEPLYFNSPPARYGMMNFNITNATLVLADPINLCSKQTADFTGKIVVASHNGCGANNKLQIALENGALAVLAYLEGPRQGYAGNFYWRTINGRWAPSDSIPYLVVNSTDGATIRDILGNITDSDIVTGDVYSDAEPNQWKYVLDTSNQYLTVAIVLIIANAAGLGFALSRLISLIMTKGCSRTTSHFTLSFICAGHTSTIIYFTINIIDIKTGPVAPEVVHNIFLVFPELFQLLASLIVSLYWFELISSVSSAPISFVKKLFKPFIAFAIIITVLYVLAMILFSLHINDIIIIVFYLVYVAISILVATIWIIIGGKMVHYIKMRESSDKKSKNFNRLSALIIICAVFLIVTRIFYLWFGLDPSVQGYPNNWLLVQTCIFIFQLATSFIQTGLFKFHKRDFKSSGQGSSGDSKNNARAVSTTKLTETVATYNGDSTVVETMVENIEMNDDSISSSSSSSEKQNSTEQIKLVPIIIDEDLKSSKSSESSSASSSSSDTSSSHASSD